MAHFIVKDQYRELAIIMLILINKTDGKSSEDMYLYLWKRLWFSKFFLKNSISKVCSENELLIE